VQHYPLRSLSVQAWSQFFQSRSISIETPALATLHDAYGGNAKAMDIISGAVLEDFSGDVEAYWQANQDDLFIERDLEDLVTKQFDRLQELDPDAYKLLCRMGCYRYQDVPTVPIEGLFCLLWDVPENRHRRVIKTLQDRSIVDFEKDEFWLHPVIREEAIARLRRSDSWEAANLKSANFWEASVQSIENINDAIRAFETCFHHLTIRNFDRAGYFFLSKRKDKSVGYNLIELGRSFNRLGLFRPMIEPISTVIENTTSSYLTSRLYGLLSLPYRIVGKPLKAIEYNYQSIKLAEDYLESLIQKGDEDLLEFKFLKLNSLLQIGLCQLDLWELEKAHDIFCESSKIEQEIKVNCSSSEAIKYNFGKYGANCFLVFTKTCLQPDRRELAIINEIYQGMKLNSKIGTGYRLIFLGAAYKNLGEFNRALEIYQEVVNHSEKFQYLGPDAIALRHIGEVYMRKKNFSLAISSHIRAIDLFSKTGAFGDLAKTYYQLGLTYRENGEVEKSHESFQEAIRLFGEMEAPKQVERVRQSMQN
jgi:tetratricopeptide (TPR) repeat protein